jgi:hypothetical protein
MKSVKYLYFTLFLVIKTITNYEITNYELRIKNYELKITKIVE